MDLLPVLPFLKRFALKLTHDEDRANDLLHDTVVRALTYKEKFDGRN